MPVEGMSPEEIEAKFGLVRDFLPGRLPPGSYTDDTEMTLGVAESLLEVGGFNGAHMALKLYSNLDLRRGYGLDPVVLGWIASGEPWEEASKKLFGGEGSYGNGGAIRVAPIGLLYHDEPERLMRSAAASARITHAHPLGVEGAVIQAYAVALALKAAPPLEAEKFLKDLQPAVQSQLFKDKIRTVRGLLASGKPAPRREVFRRLGCGVQAFNSVPAALYAFLSHPESFEEALVYAVNLGGDSDSIGSMTGALAGAYHGFKAIPKRWTSRLEGLDRLVRLGEELWKLKEKL